MKQDHEQLSRQRAREVTLAEGNLGAKHPNRQYAFDEANIGDALLEIIDAQYHEIQDQRLEIGQHVSDIEHLRN